MAGTEKVDFNIYANNYDKILESDLKFFGEENSYFADYKVKIVKENFLKDPKQILEYGCGIGRNLKFFEKYFPGSEISGCDISGKSIQVAKEENRNVNLFLIEENVLNESQNKFDLVFVSCVLHHIAPELRDDALNKISSLLKPGGSLFIFEHNPLNPLTRKIVRDCIWDKDAILLDMSETERLMKGAGINVEKKKFTLFFPGFLNFLRSAEKYLGSIPMGGQYFVKGVKGY